MTHPPLAWLVALALATTPVSSGCDGSGGAAPEAADAFEAADVATVANPVHFRAPQIDLVADDFRLVVNGVTFLADVARVEVGSTPGSSSAVTLQLAWEEHGAPMKLWIFFKSDAGRWWCDQIRTADGTPEGAWLYYRGTLFERPVGEAFTGSLSIDSTPDAWTTNGTGTVTLQGLRVLAFAPTR